MPEQTPPDSPKGPSGNAPVTPPNPPSQTSQAWVPSPGSLDSKPGESESTSDPFSGSPKTGDGKGPTPLIQKFLESKDEKGVEDSKAKEKALIQEAEAAETASPGGSAGNAPGLAPSLVSAQMANRIAERQASFATPSKKPKPQGARDRASSASLPQSSVPGGEQRATSAKDKRPSSRASSRAASSADLGRSNVRQATDSASSSQSNQPPSQPSSLKSAPSPKGKEIEKRPSTLERQLSQSRALRQRINSLSISKDGNNIILGPPRSQSTSPGRRAPPSRSSSFLSNVTTPNKEPQKATAASKHDDSGEAPELKKAPSGLGKDSTSADKEESQQEELGMEGEIKQSPPAGRWRRSLQVQTKGEAKGLLVDIPGPASGLPAGQKSARIPLTPYTPRASAGEFLAELQECMKGAVAHLKKDMEDDENIKFTFGKFMNAINITRAKDYAASEGEPFGDNEGITVEVLDRVLAELTPGPDTGLDQDVRKKNWELQQALEASEEELYNVITSLGSKDDEIRELEQEITTLESNGQKLNTQVRKLNKSLMDTQNLLRQQSAKTGDNVQESDRIQQLQKDYDRASYELELSEQERGKLQDSLEDVQSELVHWKETSKFLDALTMTNVQTGPQTAEGHVTTGSGKDLQQVQEKLEKLEHKYKKARVALAEARGGKLDDDEFSDTSLPPTPEGLNLTKAQIEESLEMIARVEEQESELRHVKNELVEALDLQETLKGQLKDSEDEVRGLEEALRAGKGTTQGSNPSEPGENPPSKLSPHSTETSEGNLGEEIRKSRGSQGPPTDPGQIYHEPCENCVPIYLYHPDSYLRSSRKFPMRHYEETIPSVSQPETYRERSQSLRSRESVRQEGSANRQGCCEHFDPDTKYCTCEGMCPAHPCCQDWIHGVGCTCDRKCPEHDCCTHYKDGECRCDEACDLHPCCEHYDIGSCRCEGEGEGVKHSEENLRECPTWEHGGCSCSCSCPQHNICEHWVEETQTYSCQEPCTQRATTGACDHPTDETTGKASCEKTCDKNPCCRHCDPFSRPPKCKCGGRCRQHACCGHWTRDKGTCGCDKACTVHNPEERSNQQGSYQSLSIRRGKPVFRYLTTRESQPGAISSLAPSSGGPPSWTANRGSPPIIGYVCLKHQGLPLQANSRQENPISQNLGLFGWLFGTVFEDPPHDIWQLLLCILFLPIYLLYNIRNILAQHPWQSLPKFLPKGTVVTLTRVFSLVYLVCLFISLKEERRIWLRANGATAAYLRDIRSRSPYPWWSPVEADPRFLEPWLGHITEVMHRHFFPRRYAA